MKTSYGLEFMLLPSEQLDRFEEYDRSVAECHIANCGSIIVDSVYEQPIDNEYDLEDIYNLINAK